MTSIKVKSPKNEFIFTKSKCENDAIRISKKNLVYWYVFDEYNILLIESLQGGPPSVSWGNGHITGICEMDQILWPSMHNIKYPGNLAWIVNIHLVALPFPPSSVNYAQVFVKALSKQGPNFLPLRQQKEQHQNMTKWEDKDGCEAAVVLLYLKRSKN